MANSLLTVTAITRKALEVLHQKLTFVGSVDRQYDDSFATSGGGKNGGSLRIRLPNEYTVTTGATLAAQETSETNVTLTVATQKHVGMYFTTAELALSMEDFNERVISPAMSALAANVEADCLQNLTKDVMNLVDNDGNPLTFRNVLDGRAKLNDNLAPYGSRTALLSSTHNAAIVDALKGLFQDSSGISKQYREGVMGYTAGFEFAESTHVANHTTGTAVEGDSVYNVNGASQSGATLTVNTGTTTFLEGDIITIAGCNAVHPETKTDLGYAQQFVLTANSGASATSLAISPSIVTSGARQNVSAAPTNGGAITKVGAGNGELLNGSLLYHKDAFTVAFADLEMPNGVDFARREVFDGISLRLVRQYDINNDRLPCRVDVLYGYLAQRPRHAVRLHADG